MTLRSAMMQDTVVTPTPIGTTQGSPLSPLLSNLVLDELDKEIEKRGLEHCRFADDCNVFVKTQKAAERVMASISKFIEKRLKLVVNQEKSKIAESAQVKFLGMTVIDGTRAIAKKSMKKAMDKGEGTDTPGHLRNSGSYDKAYQQMVHGMVGILWHDAVSQPAENNRGPY